MADFKVIDVINGDTLKLSPGWTWRLNDESTIKGETIKIVGIKLPIRESYEFSFTVEKLKKLLLNKEITIKNPVVLPEKTNDALIAGRIVLNDVDVANYFPEYKY